MAKVRINGDTSGYIELASPAAAGSNTLTLPSSNGSANQLLKNSGTAGTLAWSTLTEDSSGNLNIDSGTLYVDAINNRVGIGTTSPTYILDLNNASTYTTIGLRQGGTLYGYVEGGSAQVKLGSNAAIPVNFEINGTEAARFDSSRRLLVGTSSVSAVTDGNINPRLEVEGTDGSTGAIAVIRNSNDSNGAGLVIAKSRGSAAGSNTSVSSGDTIGEIRFEGADGTQKRIAASIGTSVDGTPGANDMPGRLVFSTTADGASSPTERARFNNQGELLVGTTTRTANGGVLQISNGITFPATQSACTDPNTLDDYEEGTWTPGLGGAATATYTSRTGTYTKIGNRVILFFEIRLATLSGSGTTWLTGGPFTPSGDEGDTGVVAITSGGSGANTSFSMVFNADTNIYTYTQGATARTNWQVSILTGSAVFSGTIVYKTA
jgi:hypothetical protein